MELTIFHYSFIKLFIEVQKKEQNSEIVTKYKQ